MCNKILIKKENDIRDAVNTTNTVVVMYTANQTVDSPLVRSECAKLTTLKTILLAGCTAILAYIPIIVVIILINQFSEDK